MVKTDDATHCAELTDQVHVVEFSPYEWSKNLLCIGTSQKVIVAVVKFPEELDDEIASEEGEDGESNGFCYKTLCEFHHKTRVQSLAWGPDTSLTVLPRVLSFASAGSDHVIRVFTSDMADKNQVQLAEGHRDYVNALAFDPEGATLASVSDDHTCKLWLLREDCALFHSFYLSSPGMSVSWHATDPGKLLVAEKSGLLQFINTAAKQTLLSLDAGAVPLMAAHWAPSNGLSVAALAGGELLVWDITQPSRPVEVRVLHSQGGRWMRFCSSTDLVVASVGRPGHQLRVCNIRAKQPLLTTSLLLGSGLTWHQHLPYVCVGCDHKLCFWKVHTK